MPSSLIFAGLVVIWLLILVPGIARRRQEVPRPSQSALSGRVLERPSRSSRRRSQEVDVVQKVDQAGTDVIPDAPGAVDVDDAEIDAGTDVSAEIDAAPDVAGEVDAAPGAAGEIDAASGASDVVGEVDAGQGAAGEVGVVGWGSADSTAGADEIGRARAAADPLWQRPSARYRPGRGGFDPAAAALAAKARYVFRQRVVFALLAVAVLTAVLALVIVPGLWWPHIAVDGLLLGYLGYLRRQVRMEDAIRARRAARMAGTRCPAAAEDPELDEWARRGQAAAAGWADGAKRSDAANAGSSRRAADESATGNGADDDQKSGVESGSVVSAAVAESELEIEPEPEVEPEPARPRRQRVAPPSLPFGTAVVGADDLDPDLPDTGGRIGPTYRRAVGQ